MFRSKIVLAGDGDPDVRDDGAVGGRRGRVRRVIALIVVVVEVVVVEKLF